ncbi:MAG: ankyrin repeat domain-containing protein [Thiolinea sp.]
MTRLVISFFSSLIILTLSTTQAYSYEYTRGYYRVLGQADSLAGSHPDYDTDFEDYCSRYAKVAVRQAQRRIDDGCRRIIPRANGRWSRNWQPHYNWCMGVTSKGSGNEIKIREKDLEQCFNNKDEVDVSPVTKSICRSRIHNMAAQGSYGFVRNCLNIGTSPNIREGNQWTPLHSAARHGHLGIVKMLLQRGAHIDAADNTGRTALDQAYIGHHQNVINHLEDEGATARDY